MNPNLLFPPIYKFLLKPGTEIEFLDNLSIFLRSERCRGLSTTRVCLHFKITFAVLLGTFVVFLEHIIHLNGLFRVNKNNSK